MAKNIEPSLRKIGDYLKLDEDFKFVVPAYQRAYSWEKDQCDKLFQDIDEFEATKTDPYFFGTIILNCKDILNCKEEEKDYKELVIIDGQQRTITFILLLKALLIRLNEVIAETPDEEKSADVKEALQDQRKEILKILYKAGNLELRNIQDHLKESKEIFLNESINEMYQDELRNILISVDFEEAEGKVEQIKYKQKDNKYTNYFKNFKFFYEKLKDNKYHNLVHLLKFAEKILKKTDIIEIRSWNVDQAISMFNSLNSKGMPLLDADIISATLYSNAEESDKGEFIEKWKKLKEIASDLEKPTNVNLDAILMYLMYIKRAEGGISDVTMPGLRRYYTESKDKLLEKPLKLVDDLLYLSEIWKKVQDYDSIKLLLKFNLNIKIYLTAYLSRFELDEIDEKLVEEFVVTILRLFTVLEVVDLSYSSSPFKVYLFKLIIDLTNKEVGIDEIKNNISKHINKSWERKEIIVDSIKDYSKNNLVFLNEYLFSKKHGKEFSLEGSFDIEHIMPKSGANQVSIRKDAGIKDKEEFDSYVDKLGNKILLETKINRSIGNDWFRTKISGSVKGKSGYQDSRFALASSIAKTYSNIATPTWSIKDIDNITEIIAERIADFIFDAE
ncbi:MAG TPA: DUF262 domain-containing HNH endonuclease family protein [Candidatus Cloacimonadota bacterium]|nr:DUF262 domain-containing HNH endonuclease family protein [Candidatus Cloacimonadota bacterium]